MRTAEKTFDETHETAGDGSSALAALRSLAATDASLGTAIARVTLGLVMLPHGLQKLVGWFGGYGFTGTMGYFTGDVGLPWILAFAVIMAESFGALALIVGAGARIAAAGIISVMTGAIFVEHLPHGFFMNWYGNQAGEGFEFHLLAIALGAVVLLSGAGAASVDGAVARKLGSR